MAVSVESVRIRIISFINCLLLQFGIQSLDAIVRAECLSRFHMKFNQYACSIDEKIHATIMQVCCTLLVSGCNSQVATLSSIELALTVFSEECLHENDENGSLSSIHCL